MKNWISDFLTRSGVWSIGIALGMSMVAAVKAEVLVTHTPNLANGVLFQSGSSSGTQNADFTFNGNAKITKISWWGSNIATPANLEDFEVRLFNGLDLPDSFSVVPSASTTQTFFGNLATNQTTFTPIYRFDLDVDLSLSAGSYYLSVMNDSEPWSWLTATGGDGNNSYRIADGDMWNEDSTGDFALELNGIPEPGSMALLLLAGTALLLTRRHIHQHRQQ